MHVTRIDQGSLNNVIKTDQGYLKAPCFATRSGIFLYRNSDGSVRRELRPPEEVFAPKSMNTLAGIPITNDHPPVLLDLENTKQFACGYTGDLVEKQGDLLGVPTTITDAALILAIESREKVETSCGYKADLDETPGVWQGQPYDAIQRNIVYNHLAIVPKGRGGERVKLRLDSAYQVLDNNERENKMVKISFDALEFEVDEKLAEAVNTKINNDAEKIKNDAKTIEEMDAKITLMKADIERIKGEKAALDLEMDACKKEMDAAKIALQESKMDSAKIHEAAMVRVGLLKIAEKALPEAKFDALSDKEIKIEVIKARMPEFKADGLSDEYIEGMFQGLKEFNSRTDSLANAVNGAKSGQRLDAREKSMEADRNAWKS